MRIIIPIEEDGNCVYRAIAFSIYGNSERWREVKAAGLGSVEAKKELFESFFLPDGSDRPSGSFYPTNFTDYCKDIAIDGHFGDYIMIAAISIAMDLTVNVWCKSAVTVIGTGKTRVDLEFLPMSKDESGAHKAAHYNCVVEGKGNVESNVNNTSRTDQPAMDSSNIGGGDCGELVKGQIDVIDKVASVQVQRFLGADFESNLQEVIVLQSDAANVAQTQKVDREEGVKESDFDLNFQEALLEDCKAEASKKAKDSSSCIDLDAFAAAEAAVEDKMRRIHPKINKKARKAAEKVRAAEAAAAQVIIPIYNY
jgi:hypothetical protein